MAVQITRYKVTVWGNRETGERMFGVAAFSPKHGWMNVCEGAKACVYGKRSEADAEIVKMKDSRDADGWKLKAPAA